MALIRITRYICDWKNALGDYSCGLDAVHELGVDVEEGYQDPEEKGWSVWGSPDRVFCPAHTNEFRINGGK